MPPEEASLVSKIYLREECKEAFANWQAKLQPSLASQQGFISLEVIAPSVGIGRTEWVIIQRFHSAAERSEWRMNPQRQELMEELRPLVREDRSPAIEEIETAAEKQGGVIEVFVTQVDRSNNEAYRSWLGEIQRRESAFPGFQGMYVQAPTEVKSRTWITLLQFDSVENLDRWLTSPQRREVLQAAEPLVLALESHRVISSFAGWFAKVAPQGAMPPVWKQTMMVLLVLFPIVMLEMKFLVPWLKELNPSLSTFIGNAISVSLVSWPLMPLAINALRWWLQPPRSRAPALNIAGIAAVCSLYLIEIAFFWLF